jgi:hypothetical protein
MPLPVMGLNILREISLCEINLIWGFGFCIVILLHLFGCLESLVKDLLFVISQLLFSNEAEC